MDFNRRTWQSNQLNYVTRIYLEYGIKEGESHKILASFEGNPVCVKSYETKEEVQRAIGDLGKQMAHLGIAIVIGAGEVLDQHSAK